MSFPLHPLFTTPELRAIEQAALAAVAPGSLMARAGVAAVEHALRLLGSVVHKRILVLAGPGNNGGDALVTAHLLAELGAEAFVMPLFATPPSQADAKRAMEQCRAGRARFLSTDPAWLTDKSWDLVIDGIFGIGLRRGFNAELRSIIEAANQVTCPVLALDVPSGLDADTGALVDEHACAIVATHTITFLADKPGLHTGFGRDHAGQVSVADLDVDPALFPTAQLHLSGTVTFAAALRPRRHASHKGSHGDVAIVGGAAGMSGAPILAARAAAYCGAGRVFAFMLEPGLPYDPMQPELMLRAADELEIGRAVIVAGPGMGRTDVSRDLLAKILTSPVPVVLDADALNMIAADAQLQQQVAARSGGTLITPHPLEAARLLQKDVVQVQSARIEAARLLAHRFACIALLKGSGTVIAAPDGAAMINPTGNPALATAGSGDVLAGICGALLAQGCTLWQAAATGAWLHGAAADKLVEEGIGPIGVTAGELLAPVRTLLNRLSASRSAARRQS